MNIIIDNLLSVIACILCYCYRWHQLHITRLFADVKYWIIILENQCDIQRIGCLCCFELILNCPATDQFISVTDIIFKATSTEHWGREDYIVTVDMVCSMSVAVSSMATRCHPCQVSRVSNRTAQQLTFPVFPCLCQSPMPSCTPMFLPSVQ